MTQPCFCTSDYSSISYAWCDYTHLTRRATCTSGRPARRWRMTAAPAAHPGSPRQFPHHWTRWRPMATAAAGCRTDDWWSLTIRLTVYHQTTNCLLLSARADTSRAHGKREQLPAGGQYALHAVPALRHQKARWKNIRDRIAGGNYNHRHLRKKLLPICFLQCKSPTVLVVPAHRHVCSGHIAKEAFTMPCVWHNCPPPLRWLLIAMLSM